MIGTKIIYFHHVNINLFSCLEGMTMRNTQFISLISRIYNFRQTKPNIYTLLLIDDVETGGVENLINIFFSLNAVPHSDK